MDDARISELLQPFLETAAAESPTAALSTNVSDSADGDSELGDSKRSDRTLPVQSRKQPAVLSPAQLHSISMYIDILIRWNARINLTAIRNEEEIVTRHFGESLFGARHLLPSESPEPSPDAPITVADVGSGAGFPGIPFKIWAPKIHLTLIESDHKKAAFLSEVTRALTLTNVNVRNVRAEVLEGSRFDLVTLRAVEHFDEILPTAAALVTPQGRLALLIGAAQPTPGWEGKIAAAGPIDAELAYAAALNTSTECT